MASFKQLFSAAPINSVEEIFTRKRILFYSFISFGPATLTGLYLHSVKLDMERDNEAAKMLEYLKAKAEIEAEEEKEALVRSQMHTAQANLESLHERLRRLEEAVIGKSDSTQLPKLIIPLEDTNEETSNESNTIPENRVNLLEHEIREWWIKGGYQEQVDAWWKYLWEDDDDEFYSLEAWYAKLKAWLYDDDTVNGENISSQSLLQAVHSFVAIDPTMSWLRNKERIQLKIQEKLEEATELQHAQEQEKVKTQQAAEKEIEKRVLERFEKKKSKSGISTRIEHGQNITQKNEN